MTKNALYQTIGRWKELAAQLETIKAQEMALRKEVFEAAFTAPIEGSNTYELPEGWKLQATHKLNRSIDAAALPAVLEQLRKKHVDTEKLIRYKPELAVTAYRDLPPPLMHIVDQALTIAPGAPALKLIAPKG